jgi:phosphoenolpyruvate synthase/pyruvate phosphate dikinase
MKKVLKFEDSLCKKVSVSGGKGASLAHMTQYGIPVPNGFVVSASVFDEVVDSNKVMDMLKNVEKWEFDEISELSLALQGYIMSLTIPSNIKEEIYKVFDEQNLSLVAVRSSATSEDTKDASWAGELKTYLNSTKIDILEKVKECWGSLFSPRALLYRFEKGFKDENVSVAVVVQQMIQSEISGVCFTIHPVTNRKSHMLIEAVYGLGEAIVSGQVTPDQYLYDKEYNVVLRLEKKSQARQLNLPKNLKGIVWEKTPSRLQSKSKLTYSQILELASYCNNVESYYGIPQDIEWALWGNSFYILQSRPITTIS